MSRRLDSLLDVQRRHDCASNDHAMRNVNRAARMVTTQAGITIGIAYMPKPQRQGYHAERIQTALLDERTTQRLTGWRRFVGFLWSKA